MKNFSRILSVFVFALLLTGVFTLGGCEKTNDVAGIAVDSETLQLESKVNQIDPAIVSEIKWLVKNGFIPSEEYSQRLEFVVNRKQSTNDLIGSEDGYYVAPDSFYRRSAVQEMMKESINDRQARHRRKTYMTNAGTKSVRIHNNLNAAWRTATTNAISAWNALGYTIKFAGSSPSSYSDVAGAIDIVVASGNAYNIPTSVYAFTEVIGCNTCVSEVIRINSDYNLTAPGVDAKKMIMSHELGHSIGLEHTDTVLGSDVSPAITCNGISGYTDFNSIMRSSIASNASWGTGFTTCDKTVIDYYWGNIV